MSENSEQRFTLTKAERLCGETTVARLFTEGRSFVKFPLRVVYTAEESSEAGLPKMLVSVPKKRFKRAVKRNRVKRLVREAYRLNKHTLAAAAAGRQVNLAFVLIDNQLPTQRQITNAVSLALSRIAAELSPEKPEPCDA